MDSKMRVAKILTKFMIHEGNRHRITLAWKDFSFLVAGPESMRGRELERVFESYTVFERVWRRNEMEYYFPFEVLTRAFERDSRELPSSFLKRKESKVRWGNSDFCLLVGIERLLRCSSCLRKSKKRWGGACSLHGRPSLGLWVCQHAWYIDITCVEFSLVACVGGVITITSHVSYA